MYYTRWFIAIYTCVTLVWRLYICVIVILCCEVNHLQHTHQTDIAGDFSPAVYCVVVI